MRTVTDKNSNPDKIEQQKLAVERSRELERQATEWAFAEPFWHHSRVLIWMLLGDREKINSSELTPARYKRRPGASNAAMSP
jgi:hypothetical protein